MKKTFTCNAGLSAASILPDGSVNVCYDRRTENLGNIYTGFRFRRGLVECDKLHCSCPLWAFEKELHKKAKGEPAIERPYHAYLHWHITYECQMLCNYCIVTGPDRRTDMEDKLRKSAPVDIDAVERTLDATGMNFYISMMGGEPFMVENMTEVVKRLTRKHWVGFNTNLCAMDPGFWKEIDHSKLGNFHISLHVHPMERRKLTDRFLANYHAMVDSGFTNFNVTAVAHPHLLARIDEYRKFFGGHGIRFQLIPMLEGGGASGGKIYPESYTPEELKLIESHWLDDYFPQENALQKAPKITNFRPRSLNNADHLMIDGDTKPDKEG